MTRILAVALLAALSAPLFSGDLVQKVFEQKIADDWYRDFQKWVAGVCEGEGFVDTYFNVQEEPELHRILQIDGEKLIARRLETNNGERTEVGDQLAYEWKQWQPKYIAAVYPLSTSDQDVVAFAIWLYLNADNDLLGNRVLTVVYERNEDLRDDVADYVRERHGWKSRERIEVATYWDTEFAKWRRVLLTSKEADELAEDRKRLEKRIHELLEEYANPEARTLTLDQIEFSIREWLTLFDTTDVHRRVAKNVTKTLTAIEKDRSKIATFLDLADARAENNTGWDETAGDYEKALALDPCSPMLLSKAANAWLKHGNPEFLKNEWICTHEGSIRKAKDLYYRWLENEAGNKSVMDQIIICHRVLGEENEAQTMLDRKNQLD